MGIASRTAPGGTSQHLAEACQDESCMRLPCRMYKAGYRDGWDKGYQQGWIEGEAAGFAAGYGAGFAAGMATGGGG
jgi:hypothetical protein